MKINYYEETPKIKEEKERLRKIINRIKNDADGEIKQLGYSWVMQNEKMAEFLVKNLSTPMNEMNFEAIENFARKQPYQMNNIIWSYEYLHIANDGKIERRSIPKKETPSRPYDERVEALCNEIKAQFPDVMMNDWVSMLNYSSTFDTFRYDIFADSVDEALRRGSIFLPKYPEETDNYLKYYKEYYCYNK